MAKAIVNLWTWGRGRAQSDYSDGYELSWSIHDRRALAEELGCHALEIDPRDEAHARKAYEHEADLIEARARNEAVSGPDCP